MTEEIPINYDDTTENDKLRELVAEWRQAAENDADKGYTNAAGTWAMAANELEQVLADE